MTHIQRVLYTLLIILGVFLALSAVPGGIALLIGFNAPPVSQLSGSVFRDFTIPGLTLLFLVGGSAILATLLLVRKHRFALPSAFASGLIVMCFEFVEVLAIGSPPGPGRIMQALYFGVGVGLATASVTSLVIGHTSQSGSSRDR